jgi:hypothetical protein
VIALLTAEEWGPRGGNIAYSRGRGGVQGVVTSLTAEEGGSKG